LAGFFIFSCIKKAAYARINEKAKSLMQEGRRMYKYVDSLKDMAEAGDRDAGSKYEKIMECLRSMDDDRVANCIILMKEYIPELWNQSALLLKKYIVDESRSLDFLSKDEIELIKFLREYLKEQEYSKH
jgi:hypothetical protein